MLNKMILAVGKIGLGLGGLFSLFVSAIFIAPFLNTVVTWNDMQGWRPVQAYVAPNGDHADTRHLAYGSYTYSFEGRQYASDRIAPLSDKDDAAFQIKLANHLAEAVREKQPIQAYVNPVDPREAVISRDLRWNLVGIRLLGGVTFAGLGLGILISILRRPRAVNTDFPSDRPWLARKDWQENQIVPASLRNERNESLKWGFLVAWNALSVPVLFIAARLLLQGDASGLIGLLFALAGAGLLIWGSEERRQMNRFRNAFIQMDPFPGSIGGQVGGRIDLPLTYDPSLKIAVTLSSILSEYRGGRGARVEGIVWENSALAYTEASLDGTRVIFCFDVPPNMDASEALPIDRDYYLWRLNVRDNFGKTLNLNYEIPAYPTGQKGHIPVNTVEASKKASAHMMHDRMLARFRLESGPHGNELFYPMGRDIGGALPMIIAGAICCTMPSLIATIITALWCRRGHCDYSLEHNSFFLSIIFLAGVACFGFLYLPANSLRVRKNGNDGIETIRCIFGIPVQKRQAALKDIKAVKKRGFYAGPGVSGRYAIIATLPKRIKIMLGEGFYGDDEADAAIAFIKKTLGIRV